MTSIDFSTRVTIHAPIEPLMWFDPETADRTAYVIEQVEIQYYNNADDGASTDVYVLGRPASKRDESKPDRRQRTRTLFVPRELKIMILKENGLDIDELVRRATTPVPGPDPDEE